MCHVTYIILFGLDIEYLGPSMTPPASHVIPKIEIFGLKNGVDSKIYTPKTHRLVATNVMGPF